jgi:hypothetical protein
VVVNGATLSNRARGVALANLVADARKLVVLAEAVAGLVDGTLATSDLCESLLLPESLGVLLGSSLCGAELLE